MNKNEFIERLVEEIQEERNNLFDQIRKLDNYDDSIKLVARIEELNVITGKIVNIIEKDAYYDKIAEAYGYGKSNKTE